MKKLVFSLIVLFIYQSLFSATLYVKGETLNFRNSPDGEKIGVLYLGTELDSIKEKGEWVKVNVEGWVWKPLTVSEKPKKVITEKPLFKPKIYRIVMWDAYLHSGPSSNYSKIGTIKEGEKLEILKEKVLTFKGISVPWYYVRKNNGEKGWVSDADLELP